MEVVLPILNKQILCVFTYVSLYASVFICANAHESLFEYFYYDLILFYDSRFLIQDSYIYSHNLYKQKTVRKPIFF